MGVAMMCQMETDEDASRDEALGSTLKPALETLAAATGGRFPPETNRAMLRAMAEQSIAGAKTRSGIAVAARLGIAAALAAAAGGAVTVAYTTSRHAGRAEALAFARAILPDNSAWVGEAMAGNPSSPGGIHDFVESLWKTTDGPDPFGPTL
jgi:hypothetical protein